MFENNQLSLPLAYILVLVLCLTSLALFFAKRWLERDLYGKPRLLFYGLFGSMLLVDFVWSTLEYSGHRHRSVAFLANLFWYGAFLVICWRWLEVCLRNLNANRLKRLVPLPVRILPVVFTTAFVASSWWTGWAIDTTPSGCYLRGPHLWVVYTTVFAYLLSTVAICLAKGVRSQELTKRRFAYSLLMATGPMILTTGLQYYTGFAFVFIGVIITTAIYEFDAQRRVMEMLVATDKARHDAFTMVSHDIRTPLNAIIGLAELLRDEKSEAERQRMQHAIVTSSRTLLQLVNDVLDLAKLEAGKLDILPEPTDLSGLVNSVLLVFADSAKEKGLALVNNVPDAPHYVVDPQRIRQILFNLIGNALKFTEAGGIRVSSAYANGILSLAVADTGCGISASDQQILTNPYAQVGRHKGRVGTGLGLSICKRLTLLMDGSLSIASELGHGSTFTINVPCATHAADAKHPVTKEAHSGAASRRILMVDDEPLNLKVMSALFAKLGQRDITLAHDGTEALNLLNASPERFDLVLTDLQMPKMDGDDLVRAIRGAPLLAHLPVHLITADIQAQTDCADVGFTGIIVKPVTLAKLEPVLR